MKKWNLIYLILYIGLLQAQQVQVSGYLVNTFEEALSNCSIQLLGDSTPVFSDNQGFFTLPLPASFSRGVLVIQTPLGTQIEIEIERTDSDHVHLGYWKIEEDSQEAYAIEQLDWETILEEDQNFDRGQIGSVLQAQRDLFLNTVAFQFSPTFYRLRGLDTSLQEVRINGMVMHSFFRGSPQWSRWGGLNDFSNRVQQFYDGTNGETFGFGGFLSTTLLDFRPTALREGFKISQAFSNSSYRFRTMFSAVIKNQKRGLGMGLLMSRRTGPQGYVEGTTYRAWSVAFLLEKIWNPEHQTWFTALYTPNQRGKSAPLTQEVFDLKGRQYNPYWGNQNGQIRNSRTVRTETPIITLNHRWEPNQRTTLQGNFGWTFGTLGSSRIGYTGQELIDGILSGGGKNPDPTYYQNLPSYALRWETEKDYSKAYHLQRALQDGGQLDWNELYKANRSTNGYGIYSLYEDVQKLQQLQFGIQHSQRISTKIKIQSELRFTDENATFLAQPMDLLGAEFLWDYNPYAATFEQVSNQLQNTEPKIGLKTPFQYHYVMRTNATHFASTVNYEREGVQAFFGLEGAIQFYMREGLFQNGTFPDHSLGTFGKKEFLTSGLKGGVSFAITGRHRLNFTGQISQKPPSFSNVYVNPREHAFTVPNTKVETNKQLRLTYYWQGLSFDFKTQWYWINRRNLQEVGFYFADGVGGDTALFVQEITQGMTHQHMGLVSSFSYALVPEFKIAAVASIGDFRYANNPNLYLGTAPSNSVTQLVFDQGIKSFGKASLKNYKLAGGPQNAFSLSLHYEDPNFWRMSVYGNYFSHAYLDPNPFLRTQNFSLDSDGLPFSDFDEEQAAFLLKQEGFPSYFLLNATAGKSWRLGTAYAGFFFSVQNILDQLYKTGGYEQGRNANFRSLNEDFNRQTPLFSPKYWWGRGTTYFISTYYRF